MSYALLFSGQGTQHADMLPWLEELAPQSPLLRDLDALLGSPWRGFAADAQLRQANRVAQPLITATALAAWELLQPLLPGLPTAVAGYSVGEIAACACAGVYSPQQAVQLSARRAACMDSALHGVPAGLMSVSGVGVDQVLRDHGQLHCAIVLGRDHAVYGGLDGPLKDAQSQLEHSGATCKRLDIAVPSHTPLMEDASVCFAEVLEACELAPARFPVVANATAALSRRVQDLRPALSRQISHTLDWVACMDAMAETGVRCVLEVGPGRSLANLWNRSHADIPARALEDFRDPQGAAQWVQRAAMR